jgi:hypothetical protein
MSQIDDQVNDIVARSEAVAAELAAFANSALNIVIPDANTAIPGVFETILVGSDNDNNIGPAADATLKVITDQTTPYDDNPIFVTYSGSFKSGGVISVRKARGSQANVQPLEDGDIVGGLFASGHDGTDFQFSSGLRFKVDGVVNAAATVETPMKIVMETKDETGSFAERLVVNPAGNIGIGTSEPTALLDVRSESSVSVAIDGNTGTQSLRYRSNGITGARIASEAVNQNLIFDTGGSGNEAMRINSSGFVGIGTSNPSKLLTLEDDGPVQIRLQQLNDANEWFQIAQNGSNQAAFKSSANGAFGGYLFVSEDGTSSVTRMVIDSNGDVSIGAANGNPDSRLHIGDTAPVFIIEDTSASSLINSAGSVEFQRQAGFVYGGLYNIAATSELKLGTNFGSGFLTFATDNDVERMRIDSIGRVMVGTDTYGYGPVDLHVGSTSDTQNGIAVQSSNTGYGYLLFGDGSGTDSYVGQVSYSHSIDSMDFITNNSQAMRIDANRNVGIGNIIASSFNSVGAENLVVGSGAGNEGITVYSGAANYGALAFADGTGSLDQYRGLIQYGHAADSLNFFTNAVQRMTIDSSGNVGISDLSPRSFGAGVPTLSFKGNSAGNPTRAGAISFESNSGTQGLAALYSDAGNIDFYTGSTTSDSFRVRIDSNGNLLVGKTSTGLVADGVQLSNLGVGIVYGAGTPLSLRRTAAGTILQFNRGGVNEGTIQMNTGAAPTFASGSDIRLKDNVVDHRPELDNLMSLRVTEWDWKDESKGSGEGFIAQELQETAWADLVSEGDDGMLQVSGLGTVETRLIKAMQEQQAMIEALKAEVESLKNA